MNDVRQLVEMMAEFHRATVIYVLFPSEGELLNDREFTIRVTCENLAKLLVDQWPHELAYMGMEATYTLTDHSTLMVRGEARDSRGYYLTRARETVVPIRVCQLFAADLPGILDRTGVLVRMTGRQPIG